MEIWKRLQATDPEGKDCPTLLIVEPETRTLDDEHSTTFMGCPNLIRQMERYR